MTRGAVTRGAVTRAGTTVAAGVSHAPGASAPGADGTTGSAAVATDAVQADGTVASFAAGRGAVRTVVTLGAGCALLFAAVVLRQGVAVFARAGESLAGGARALALAQTIALVLLPVGTAALALALAWRGTSRPDTRALALFLALLGYAPSGDLVASVLQQLAGPAAREAGYALRDTLYLLACAALVRFAAVFPRPLAVAELGRGRWAALRAAPLDGPRWWRAAALGALAGAGAMQLVGALGVGARGRAAAVALCSAAPGSSARALAAADLRARRARLTDAERRRLYWVLQGLVAASAVAAVASAVRLAELFGLWAIPVASWYVLTVIAGLDLAVLFLAVAMFYEGAFDPALAIRRTALAGVVATVMVFVFVGAEQLLEETLRRWTGVSDRLGGIVTGGVVAFSFEPVKRRVERVVERGLARLGVAPAGDGARPDA